MYPLPVTYLLVTIISNKREISVAKNVGVAVAIVFLTSVGLKMDYVKPRSQVVVTTSDFETPFWLSDGC